MLDTHKDLSERACISILVTVLQLITLGPDKVASAFKGSNRACTSIWAGTEMNQLVMRFILVPFNLTLSLFYFAFCKHKLVKQYTFKTKHTFSLQKFGLLKFLDHPFEYPTTYSFPRERMELTLPLFLP
jgi:hypothetical protein